MRAAPAACSARYKSRDGAARATPRAGRLRAALCSGLDVGAEIVTNYGEVSNADHLMSHGFALRGSTHETFAPASPTASSTSTRPAARPVSWGLYELRLITGSSSRLARRITGVPAE